MSKKTRVCVIGAGPRGLIVARHLLESPNTEVVVFESKSEVGGQWFYEHDKSALTDKLEEAKKFDNYCKLYGDVHQSVHRDLLCNLPHFCMEFKDYSIRDFDPEAPSILNAKGYQQYLVAYAKHFKLYDVIRLKRLVKSVRLTKNLKTSEQAPDQRRFTIQTINADGGNLNEDLKVEGFDYVVCTSGQFSVPYIPEMPNFNLYKGEAVHAKNVPFANGKEFFKNKKILLIGKGPSSFDILCTMFYPENEGQRCDNFKNVTIQVPGINDYLKNSRDFQPFVDSGKLKLIDQGIREFTQNGVKFSNMQEEDYDLVIFATGYKFCLPYFDLENDRIIDYNPEADRGHFFGPLYQRFVSVREPHCFFIGFICNSIGGHQICELQAMAVRYLVEGKIQMPSQEERQKSFDTEKALHQKNLGGLHKFYHLNLHRQFPDMEFSDEFAVKEFFRNWILESGFKNDWEKSEKFTGYIKTTIEKMFKHFFAGDFYSHAQQDFFKTYDRDFRDTTEFV